MSNLFIYYEKSLIGLLTKNPDATLSFEYDNNWISLETAFALSPVLDLKHFGPFNNRESLAFFENLIPEGDIKNRLEKLIGRSLNSGYQFLEQYGVDCAGAFIITPNKEAPDLVVDNEFDKLNMADLSAAHKNNESLMTHVIINYNGRFSLAGAQDKIPVVLYEGELYIPTKGAPTTHILKPPHLSKSVKESVYNEYFCMKLAKSCGLDVAEVDIIVDDIPFYITERYDRDSSSDGIKRLHQVDFCQVQNYLVSEKYESDGGPGLRENFESIQKYSAQVITDTRAYMKWICFNILIGNNDSHAKNISFLLKDKRFILSPFYDLMCTSIYKEYSSDFAFKMGGSSYWGQWKSSHFRDEVCSWGFDKNPDLLLETFLNLKDKMESVLDNEVKIFKERFPNVKVAGRIKTEIIKRNISFTKRLFS